MRRGNILIAVAKVHKTTRVARSGLSTITVFLSHSLYVAENEDGDVGITRVRALTLSHGSNHSIALTLHSTEGLLTSC